MDNLPGPPDGISKAEDGSTFWVTIYSPVGYREAGPCIGVAAAAAAVGLWCEGRGCPTGVLERLSRSTRWHQQGSDMAA
jgi:hypothetical protein